MNFKVKDPYRKVELVAKKHVKAIKNCKSDAELWSMLDHYFWEAFSKIIVYKHIQI